MTSSIPTKRTIFPWLTVEVALYGVILCLALALRLGGLGIRVIDIAEAEQAWQAWQLAHGEAPSGVYLSLLLSGQALLFALFGANDIVARLLPALAGSTTVVLPYFMRARLGRSGALMAALALAVSPTLTYTSRYGGGTAFLLAAVLGVLALWFAYREARRTRYLYAIAILGAIAVLSDPRVIGILIVLAFAWAAERFFFARDVLALEPHESIPWKGVGISFGLTLLLGATAFGLNVGGLGAWADYPSLWAQHFAPLLNGQPVYYPLAALLLYEPLLLVFGTIGAVDTIVRRDEVAIFVWIAFGAVVLALLAGGRNAEDVALVCAFLSLLAGRALGNLIEDWHEHALWSREGIFVLVLLGILIIVGLQASFYARALYLNLAAAPQFLWFWLLAIALVILLVGLALAWFGLEIAWRAVGAVLAIALLMIAFRSAIGLNYRLANDPRELHVLSASDVGVRDALGVMAQYSFRERGYPTSMPVTVDATLGPVWRWYLRDWEEVAFVVELSPSVTTDMVLTSEQGIDPAQAGGWNPAQRYIGQDFVTRTWWQPSQLLANDPLTWWLYRKSIQGPIPMQKAILWVRAPEQAAQVE